MLKNNNITAIILSGGKSSRIGKDKGLMMYQHQPMITHVIAVAKKITDKIIIISNQKGYEQFGFPVYQDLIKNKGPLAGIYTGLHYSSTKKNIVLSCDIPLVSVELLQFLIQKSDKFDITIPEKNGKTHQLIGIFIKNCLETFTKAINNDQLKAIRVFETLNLNIVDANEFDEDNFKNINYKSDVTN